MRARTSSGGAGTRRRAAGLGDGVTGWGTRCVEASAGVGSGAVADTGVDAPAGSAERVAGAPDSADQGWTVTTRVSTPATRTHPATLHPRPERFMATAGGRTARVRLG